MTKVPELFGSMVFGERVMRERLPKDIFKALQNTIKSGNPISSEVADVVANAMKDWAIEKGATHYTHWFQPMTGVTAEKHDSFIQPADGGSVIMNFSGKQLIKGEPDASSFPSGGLRSTFEARGYTAWDPTSYAFVKDSVLYIPTAFISFSGQVLDKKTPLLRSMDTLSKAALRVLKLFGKKPCRVTPSVGPEQEYFLIPRELYKKRPDLIITGRTLFGAKPPKGQELDDHYFGHIKTRVLEYMEDLDTELWKLGIYAKTRHNEVAPAQHELAPIYSTVNIATDHNQLTMAVMRKVAKKHDLVCLLHEKPFAGVNGSGKHNNWSISTSDGENLLEPGKDLKNNLQFMLFLTAIIKAVDEHQDLLRLSVASAGNDHRLGANEAPPAIISMFLGDEITDLLETLASGKEYSNHVGNKLSTGVESVPVIYEDTTDRNRTSPFAFTGNKFEFRSLGSALNIACPNIMINAAVADALNAFADVLEKEKAADFKKAAIELIKKEYVAHRRIVFNGDNYAEAWREEAEKRGLLNLKSTPEALSYYDRPENVELFKRLKIYTDEEVRARKDILLENYCKVINIEALTMCEIALKQILPAATQFTTMLAENIINLKSLGMETTAQKDILENVSKLITAAYGAQQRLSDVQLAVKNESDLQTEANLCYSQVFEAMQELRTYCDRLETLLPKNMWPFPTYGDLLLYV
ncbi:glutamine synthetase III [Anaerocaecibacter muris]|uniref:glutamine synthetase III family protein n=1 Tax=Anaerocaecibacter muris TaxID=2941513 RepID=UPI00203A9D85|nr:glutamine synthetase III [Anaerocaecibacter muris]